MREVVLIVGLPGSGKSFLGREISVNEGYAFIDDASRTLDPDRDPALQLARYAKANGLVIADPLLCAEDGIVNARVILDRAFPGVPVRVICFENDPQACLHNVKARADGREVAELIRALTAVWRPRDLPDCEVRPVYSPSCKA